MASFGPLRPIVGAIRAILYLYFNAAGESGLDRGLVLTAIGLCAPARPIAWTVITALAMKFSVGGDSACNCAQALVLDGEEPSPHRAS